MSVVEDVRQVLQDFLAPELRATSACIEALEKTMDARFSAQSTKIEAIDRKIDSLKESLDLDRPFIQTGS